MSETSIKASERYEALKANREPYLTRARKNAKTHHPMACSPSGAIVGRMNSMIPSPT